MTPKDRELSPTALHQLFLNAQENYEDGHMRVRKDIKELERELVKRIEVCEAFGPKITRIESTPVSMEKVMFSWPVMGSVIIGAVLMSGALWEVRSEVVSAADSQKSFAQAISSSIEAQKDLDKERNDQIKESIGTIDKQQKLEAIDIQKLQQTVMSMQISTVRTR